MKNKKKLKLLALVVIFFSLVSWNKSQATNKYINVEENNVPYEKSTLLINSN